MSRKSAAAVLGAEPETPRFHLTSQVPPRPRDGKHPNYIQLSRAIVAERFSNGVTVYSSHLRGGKGGVHVAIRIPGVGLFASSDEPNETIAKAIRGAFTGTTQFVPGAAIMEAGRKAMEEVSHG